MWASPAVARFSERIQPLLSLRACPRAVAIALAACDRSQLWLAKAGKVYRFYTCLPSKKEGFDSPYPLIPKPKHPISGCFGLRPGTVSRLLGSRGESNAGTMQQSADCCREAGSRKSRVTDKGLSVTDSPYPLKTIYKLNTECYLVVSFFRPYGVVLCKDFSVQLDYIIGMNGKNSKCSMQVKRPGTYGNTYAGAGNDIVKHVAHHPGLSLPATALVLLYQTNLNPRPHRGLLI